MAGDGGRILRTSDGGASWTIVHGAGYLGNSPDVHFSNPRDGFALTYSTTLLTTSNGGNRWDETVPSGVFSLRKASMYSPDGGYAYVLDSRYNTALFSTTDAGRTWRHTGAVPITFDYVHNRMAEGICAVSRTRCSSASPTAICSRSTDAGLSWDSLFVAQEFTNQYMAGSRVFAFPPHTVQYAGSNGWRVQTISATRGSTGHSGIHMAFRSSSFSVHLRRCAAFDGKRQHDRQEHGWRTDVDDRQHRRQRSPDALFRRAEWA
ncbi:MAG: hypothetical protein IPP94_06165 [Ignavibacteria bacterium]|nr:hypothetical protein [Ignavibacteria bacterium]